MRGRSRGPDRAGTAAGRVTRPLLQELAGGDRRSTGNADAVVRNIWAAPSGLDDIIAGLTHDDRLIRMRCADVAEKVSRRHPEWLWPHKLRLVDLASRAEDQEMRWHLAQMLPRIDLDRRERARIEAILLGYLKDTSRIVQAFALQGLYDLSADDPELRRRLLAIMSALQRDGSPAVRARARKLLDIMQS